MTGRRKKVIRKTLQFCLNLHGNYIAVTTISSKHFLFTSSTLFAKSMYFHTCVLGTLYSQLVNHLPGSSRGLAIAPKLLLSDRIGLD